LASTSETDSKTAWTDALKRGLPGRLPWGSCPFHVSGASSRRPAEAVSGSQPEMPSPPDVSHVLRGSILDVRAAICAPLTCFGFSLRSFHPSDRLSHARRVAIPSRCFPRAGLPHHTPHPQGFLSGPKAVLPSRPFCRTNRSRCFPGRSSPAGTSRVSRRSGAGGFSLPALDESSPGVGRGALRTPSPGDSPRKRRKPPEAPRESGELCSFGVSSHLVGGLPKQPASHGVTLFLEALGSDVAAIGFTAPPSAFGRPRGLSSSSRLTRRCRRARPLPRTWTHLQRPTQAPPPSSRARRSCQKLAPPMEFLPVQRIRGSESATRSKVPASTPAPLDVSHVLRGLCLTPPRHQAGSKPCRWLTLVGFSSLQSFVPPRHLLWLVAEHALLDVSRRPVARLPEDRLPGHATRRRRVPEGLSAPGSWTRVEDR